MKPSFTITTVLLWLTTWFLKLGWSLMRALWRQAFGVLMAIAFGGLFTAPADAGWFTRKPDPAMEAANRALQDAAETANETAKIQADQNIRIAEAISQLSNERAQLAGHLELLGQHAAKDSAWAAALGAVGPVLVVVAVLAVGGVALWLVTRTGPADAQLMDVLLAEVTGSGPGWLALGPGAPSVPEAGRGIDIYPESKDIYSLPPPAPAYENALESTETQEGELPF